MKRVLLLLVAGVFAGQAHAGLFTDEKTAKQLKELEGRVSLLEDNSNQSSRAMMGLQSQIDTLNETVRKLQGENEELQHDLQDAEKRQKDFYIDLDTRMRKLESAASAVAAAAPPAPAPIDPVAENRDFNAAYAQFKAHKLQDSIHGFMAFLTKYPGSTLAPNAYYHMGVAYYGLHDCKNAVNSYLTAATKFPDSNTAPNALLGTSICYQELGDMTKAKKTLKQLIAKYPKSPMAPRAKKRLKSLK
ncbi:MAG TPA: tol-pal system protein YbgF [Gallionellaceae bacterium]|nr:tol-pal system protein YbgF [Gallionellaceae bacterium]